MNEDFSKLTNFNIDHLIGFAISVGIGFLIGLEREFHKQVKEKEDQFAGVRTFTLICILGFASALIADRLGAWLYGVVLAGVFALVTVSYMQMAGSPGRKGGTSEIALVLTFLLGGLVFLQFILFALMLCVITLLLLAYKPHLHRFAQKLTREELVAIISFVIISALVIPFLPDNDFGPYKLWNLKEIWKMVILVCGTSLLGYMIAKVLGNKGTLVAGIVGGLVSSTSVSLAFSRRSKIGQSGIAAFYYAMGILGACTIMFPRILFEVYVVNRPLAAHLWLPIALITIAGFGTAFFIYKTKKGKPDTESIPLKNPLDFGTAIKFALLFAAIQWLVKFCSENFGDSGIYVAGAISGVTDVDAITLSMAKMAKNTGNVPVAINTILLAALSNTLVKFIIVLVVGSAELRKTALVGFLVIFGVGLGYFLYRMVAPA